MLKQPSSCINVCVQSNISKCLSVLTKNPSTLRNIHQLLETTCGVIFLRLLSRNIYTDVQIYGFSMRLQESVCKLCSIYKISVIIITCGLLQHCNQTTYRVVQSYKRCNTRSTSWKRHNRFLEKVHQPPRYFWITNSTLHADTQAALVQSSSTFTTAGFPAPFFKTTVK